MCYRLVLMTHGFAVILVLSEERGSGSRCIEGLPDGAAF